MILHVSLEAIWWVRDATAMALVVHIGGGDAVAVAGGALGVTPLLATAVWLVRASFTGAPVGDAGVMDLRADVR